MDNILQFFSKVEALNLPCRYTVSFSNQTICICATLETFDDEKVIEYSQPAVGNINDIIDALQQFMPQATVCQYNNCILIDNLK